MACGARGAEIELDCGTESDSMPGLQTPSGSSASGSGSEGGRYEGGSSIRAAAESARLERRARKRVRRSSVSAAAEMHQRAVKKEGGWGCYYGNTLKGVSSGQKAKDGMSVSNNPRTEKSLGGLGAIDRQRVAFEEGAAPRTTAKGADTPSPRQQELRVREAMRKIGESCSRGLLSADAASEMRRLTVKKVQTFFIRDGRGDKTSSVVDSLIQRGRAELVPLHRADLTWQKYAPAWKRASGFLRAAVEADGLEFTAATLRADRRYVTAAALWCFYTTTAATSVETMVGAIRMAMRVNDIPVEDDFMTSVTRSVARRQRAMPVRKRVNFTFTEVRKIARKWGQKSATTARLMIACAIVIGFTLLLRYSDLTVVSIDGLFFTPEGIAVYIPRRKNRQAAGGSWLPLADTGREFGAVAILKRLLARLGHAVPDGFVGQMPTRRYLFRDIVPAGGYKFASVRRDMVSGDGRHPIARRAYSHYLTRIRESLRACCGYSKTEAMEFGTQSLRSGGDTHLFNNGVPQDVRMVLGQWKTPSVEEGYVRSMMSQRFELMAAIGL